eukprot:11178764-Lingulodinium_polyedra.AAC.1
MSCMVSRGCCLPNANTHGIQRSTSTKHRPRPLPWPWPALRAWPPMFRGALPAAPTPRSRAAAANRLHCHIMLALRHT